MAHLEFSKNDPFLGTITLNVKRLYIWVFVSNPRSWYDQIAMDCAGLIYDDCRHYIDHLAPFCALMDLPLIVCEDRVAELARLYYPDLKVIEKTIWNLKLPEQIITCDTRPLLQAAFPGQKINPIWLPHGNSDKGWKSPYFEALKGETMTLVYGQKMIDFLKAKNVFPKTFCVGNFRWEYFLKHQAFYEKVAQEIVPKRDKNFLYAPTWEDSENNGSFWKAFPLITGALPSSYQLLVKLHPNTVKKFEVELEILMGRYADRKNIIFLPEFPPIYPLLSRCDGYIGDMSSIGYDFLRFDKPMFFLNANGRNSLADQGLYLFRCGQELSLENLSFPLSDQLSSIRKKTYDYTFGPTPNWIQLKEKICDFSLRGL